MNFWIYTASFAGAVFLSAGATYYLCRQHYEKQILKLRWDKESESKWADEYHHKLMLCHKALKELLADVDRRVDMGIPFEDPRHGMHRSWTLAKGAVEMEI